MDPCFKYWSFKCELMKTRSKEALIRDMSLDPFAFEDLVDTWNACFDHGDQSAPALRSEELEHAVDDALNAIAQETASGTAGLQLQRLIATFDHTALIVHADGSIVTMNEVALERCAATPGQSIDLIGLSLIGGESLSSVIRKSHDRLNSDGETTLLRAISQDDERPVTLVLIPTPATAARCGLTLVFVIDPNWREKAEPLLARSFQLTDAECAVLSGFLEGKPLAEIAQARGRSVATVRTQFQTIMTKTGARSQAELMRNMLALSQFMGDIEKVADVALHPFRKRADILRPGGRTVEIFFAGDLDGELVVVLPNVTMRTFEAEIEAQFRRQGLCVATLCRPGYGASDPPVNGQDVGLCLANDYEALLDQFGVEKAVVVAQNSGSGFAFQLGGLVPERISKIVLVSAMPPHPYLERHNSTSPLASAFVRARRHSRMLFRLLMHAALRAGSMQGN